MAGKKGKPQKLGWQDFQKKFGKTRNPMDNLPTAPRAITNDDMGAGPDRLGARRYGSSRGAGDEDREEQGPSRAEESSEWRSGPSTTISRGGSSFGRDNDSGEFGRSDDVSQWRSSKPASSGFKGFGDRERSGDFGDRDRSGGQERSEWRRAGPSEAPASGRPRLNLKKPDPKRVQEAQKIQNEAKAKLEVDESKEVSPSRSMARSRVSSNPFGDARPVQKKTDELFPSSEPKRAVYTAPRPPLGSMRSSPAISSDRFRRPETASPAVNERAEALKAEIPSRSSPAPSPVVSQRAEALRQATVPGPMLAPSSERMKDPLARAKQPELAPMSVKSKRENALLKLPVNEANASPAVSLDLPEAGNLPESQELDKSPFAIALAESVPLSADELAETLETLQLEDAQTCADLAEVLKNSLAERTVALTSAISLLPKEHSCEVLKTTLSKLASEVSEKDLMALVPDSVDVVSILGLADLPEADMQAVLADAGLSAFEPKSDFAADVSAACEAGKGPGAVLKLIKQKFESGKDVPASVSRVVSRYVMKACLSGGKFDEEVLEMQEPLLRFCSNSVELQVQMLFGVQEAWWEVGRDIKRVGKAIFEKLHEMRLVNASGLVGWKDDVDDKAEGKRKLLFQVGGFISDLHMATIARAEEEEDEDAYSDASAGMDDDFPQANRNYEY